MNKPGTKNEFESLATNKPSDKDWHEIPIIGQAEKEPDVKDLLSNVFIIKLTELTRLNFVSWKKMTENSYIANWGIFEVVLWQKHYKVTNELSGESWEINTSNVFVDYLKEVLDTFFSKARMVEIMNVVLSDDVKRITQEFSKKK
jgi:hypothetical protein